MRSTSSGACREATHQHLRLLSFDHSYAKPHVPECRQRDLAAKGNVSCTLNGCGGCFRKSQMRTLSITSWAIFRTFPFCLQHLHNGRLSDRNRAMVALASRRKIPSRTICAFLGVGKAFVRKYRNKFDSEGAARLFAPQTKSNRKIDNEDLRKAIFSLLHEPPTNHGINRTSWTMALLRRVLKENGTQVGTALVAKMIKAAGYKWRKAKIVLTSNDPTYKEKLAHIRHILSNLQPDEAFFSIDEYGPFAIKAKPGRTLSPRRVFNRLSLSGKNRAAA